MQEWKGKLQSWGDNLLHWKWVKALLYWTVMSAGTVAEGCFLVASLWMSLNSSIHNFIRLFLSEDTTVHLSELATAAYVGLPECILFLASVVVISHFRTWLYNRKDKIALVWSIAYGIPTLAFLILSLFTLGSSVLNVHFEMPGYLIVIRALAGYLFGFIAFLYWSLGTPQEVDRLKEKDELIASLSLRIDTINANTKQREQVLTDEISQLKMDLAEHKNENTQLQNEINKSNGTALEAYGEECANWLNSGIKTATIDDINRFTRHSKRKITSAMTDGKLEVSRRNKNLVLITSLIEWLKNQPVKVDENITQLRVVND